MALTLAANIGTMDGSLPLSGGTLPQTIEFVEIDSEVIHVRQAGSTLLVDRGACGSTQAAHGEGSSVVPLYPVLSATAGVVYVP